MRIPKIYGYGRASTDSQQLTPYAQRQIIDEWFQRVQHDTHLYPNGCQWGDFLFDQTSATTPIFERPIGSTLPFILEPDDTLVFAKFTRAFRSAGDAETTLSKLDEMRVRTVFLDINIDTGTPNGKLIAGIMGAVARHERDMIAQRTREGMAVLRQQCRPMSHLAPTGWKTTRTSPGKPRYYAPDWGQRNICEVCRNHIRAGNSLNTVRHTLRTQTNLGNAPPGFIRSLKKGFANASIASNAAIACLKFPLVPRDDIQRLNNGRALQTVSFVTDSVQVHNKLIEKIKQHYPNAYPDSTAIHNFKLAAMK